MNIIKQIKDHFCKHRNAYENQGDLYCPDCQKIKKGPGRVEVEESVAKLFSTYIIPPDKVVSLSRYIKRSQADYPTMHRDVIFRRAVIYFKFQKRAEKT